MSISNPIIQYCRFLSLRSWVFILCMLMISSIALAEDTHPILIISSYNPDTKNTKANITEFQNEYARLGGDVSKISIENMNCKSLPEAPLWKQRMKDILDKYKGERTPSMVLILGQEAWSSYISQDKIPFRDVPVLCGMISRNAIFLPDSTDYLPDWEPTYVDIQTYRDNGWAVSGNFYSYDVDATMEMIYRLYPDVENIALMTDNTYGGIALQTFVKKEMENLSGINLHMLDGRKNDIYTVVDQIKSLPEKTIILVGTWRVDVNDAYFLGNATHTMMTANPTIPVFTLTAVGLGHWAIGGYMPDYDQQTIGKDLAKQARAILSGEIKLSEMEAKIVPNVYTFDAQKLKEFNIDTKLLPAGYRLINTDVNIFSKYKFEIMLLVITILLIFLVMIFIFFLRTKKLKDSLMDLQEDNVLIMNNMHASIKFIKPDYTTKWENDVEYPCLPQYGPDNCFLSKVPLRPFCDQCAVIKAMETKQVVETIKDCNQDGRYIHILSKPVVDDRNNILGVVVKKEDVTNQKMVEIELRKAKEKAEESDRLKSAFLANMSHEIRTPLNAIVGFSGLLAITEDQEDREEYMNIINTNNELLLQLINDILDLAKIEAGTLDFAYGDVDVNRMFTEIEQSSLLKVKPGVELKFSESIPDCIIHTDKNRLSQVINNFLNNAIKFTDEGSITFGYRHEGNELYFFVTDTGCGMTEEGAASVFTRFVKLNSFVQGTGLGLSICEMIIKKLEGEIGVDSELGVGSTFWFRLPDSIIRKNEDFQDTAVDIVASYVSPRDPDARLRLLIAEDNDSNYLLFKNMLKDFELYHALNGEEAVEMFHKYNPDIILMDIKMPVMDGYEAVREIRKTNPYIPIIAVTAYAFGDDEERVKQSGFTEYISKPVNPEKLLHVIDTYFQNEV